MRLRDVLFLAVLCGTVVVAEGVCSDGFLSSDLWVLGDPSQLCSSVCTDVGRLCDADAQTLTTDETVTAAFAEVGVDCSSHPIEYRSYAMVPFQSTASGVNCYGVSPGSTSTCSTTHAYSGHPALCRCVVTVGDETCYNPADLLPSCPTGKYTNDRWVVAELGATCDTTCGSVGLSCDSAKQTALTNLAEDALVMAFAEAGFTCDKKGSDLDYGDGRDYAGAPFTTTVSGEKVCVGFKASSSAVSSCSSIEHSSTRPLCRCVATVGEETCYDPKNEVIDLAQACGETRNAACTTTALPDSHATNVASHVLDGDVASHFQGSFELGLAYDGDPPGSAWSDSGAHGDCNDRNYYGTESLLDSGTDRSACLGGTDSWMRLDLGSSQMVHGVITQGRGPTYGQWVQTYVLQVSNDDSTYTAVTCQTLDGQGYCVGNTDDGTKVSNYLTEPVLARYVKLIVKNYNSYGSIRMSVYTETNLGSFNFLDGMGDTVLAYDGIPPASAWSTNGVHDHCNDPDHYGVSSSPPANEYDGSACLSNYASSWIQLDLGEPKMVTGIVTQGRPNKPVNPHYIKQYAIEVSDDNSVFRRIRCATEGTYDFHGHGTRDRYCLGNTDYTSLVVNDLVEPVSARYVRLWVKEYQEYAAIRMGVYVHDGWSGVRIDLQHPAYVSHLRITPRQDCCQGRSDLLQIRVGGDADDISKNPLCTLETAVAWTDGETGHKDIGCFGYGQYVYVYSFASVTDFVNIAEISVMGIEQSYINLARSCSHGACPSDSNVGFPSGGTDLQKTQNPSRAVDGVYLPTSTFYAGQTADDAWWRVEFQNTANIEKVRLSLPNDGCEPGWLISSNRCVKAFTVTKNWQDAKQACIALDAELVVPRDATDNQFLNDMVSASVWIGLNDDTSVVTTTGKTPSYLQWQSGEPSSASEDCIMLYGSYDHGNWNDASCANNYGYICEKEFSLLQITYCDSGWEFSSNRCVKAFTTTVTWEEAKQACIALDAVLVVPRDATDNDFLTSITSTYNDVWIGVHDLASENTWQTTTGDSVSYFQWNSNEPSNSGGNEHCAMLWPLSSGGNWNDGPCSSTYIYICEKESLPVPRPPPSCATGWTLISGRCVQLFQTAETWENAKQACIGHGGELAIPQSDADNEAIFDLGVSGSNVWIGVNDITTDHTWKTSLEADISYTNWYSGEPSGGTEDCAHFWSHDPAQANREWNDADCGNSNKYVCEIPATFTAIDIRVGYKPIASQNPVCATDVYPSTSNSVLAPCVGTGNFLFISKPGTATSFSLTQVEVLGSYEETCAVNHYAQTPVPYPSVVSVDDVTFDRSTTNGMVTHIDLGARTWNIRSNGGFTAIVRFMFTGSEATDCTFCRIFDFSTGPGDNSMVLTRSGDNNHFWFAILQGSTACVMDDSRTAITFNHWQTAVARYRAEDEMLELTVSSTNHLDRIFHGLEDPVTIRTTCTNGITDRTTTANYIATTNWGGDYFHGKIAGLHAFDYYLTDAECEAVLHTMVYGASRHTGSALTYAGVGRDGSFANIGAVVSLDDTWFARGSSDYVDQGTKTFNIFTNGGFTAVAKVRFLGTAQNYERIIDFGNGPHQGNIIIGRSSETSGLYCSIHVTATTHCSVQTDSNIILQNTWYNIIARWKSSNNVLEFSVNDLKFSSTCPDGINDRTVAETYIGKSHWSDPYLNGDIGGLYTFDRWLSLSETEEILDGIEINTTFFDARECSPWPYIYFNLDGSGNVDMPDYCYSDQCSNFAANGGKCLDNSGNPCHGAWCQKGSHSGGCGTLCEPTVNQLSPGNDFLGTSFLRVPEIEVKDGLVARFTLENTLNDSTCVDPCIDWVVEWTQDTVAPWGHDAWLSWATSQTVSPWTGSGPAPQSRPLFVSELWKYLNSSDNVRFPVNGADEWTYVRTDDDSAYTFLQLGTGSHKPYGFVHHSDVYYQDSSGYSHTSASWDGWFFRLSPTVRRVQLQSGTMTFMEERRGFVLDNAAGKFIIHSTTLADLLDRDAWTVTLWFKTNDVSTYNHIFSAYDYNTVNSERGGSSFGVTDARTAYVARQRTGGNNWVHLYSTSTLNLGQWYHLAAISSDRRLEIYINGILDASITASSNWARRQEPSYKIGLGQYCAGIVATNNQAGDCYDHSSAINRGWRQDLRFYDQALGPAAIQRSYSYPGNGVAIVDYIRTAPTEVRDVVFAVDDKTVNNSIPLSTPFFLVSSGTFSEVRERCQAEGADLASIVNENEHNQAYNLCNQDGNNCYIGVKADGDGQPWYWVDGMPFTYTNWLGDHRYVGSNTKIAGYEHVAVIRLNENGVWDDWGTGSSSFPGLCRYHTLGTYIDLGPKSFHTESHGGFTAVGQVKFTDRPPQNYTTWRVSNAGITEWRPAVHEIFFYSDYECTQEVAVENTFTMSANGPNTASDVPWLVFDRDYASNWRSLCCCNQHNAPCEIGELAFTVTFPEPVQIRCVKTCGNLGYTPPSSTTMGCGIAGELPGGYSWSAGILLEASNPYSEWTTIAGPTAYSNDVIVPSGNTNNEMVFLSSRYPTTSDHRIELHRSGTSDDLAVTVTEGSGSSCSATVALGADWNLVVATYEAVANTLVLEVNGVRSDTVCTAGFSIADHLRPVNWIGKALNNHQQAFRGEIAGLYIFDRALTATESAAVLAGIRPNQTDNLNVTHHHDVLLHDAHQTCVACPGDMYAPVGSTRMIQCQQLCPAGTFLETVRLFPSDRNVDPSFQYAPQESVDAEVLGDFDMSTSTSFLGIGTSVIPMEVCSSIDLGQIYPVSKIHVWMLNDRSWYNQRIILSKTGLWSTTEQTGDEITAWSCSTNCPAEPANSAGRTIEFAVTDARFVRYCTTGSNIHNWVLINELHVYGHLCTACPAGSHSPRGSTSHADCVCETGHPRDYGNYTDKYMEEKTGVNGWTLAKHLAKDGTKWYTTEYMYPHTSMYTLDGGGWRLVRRVKQGTTWHPATDSLAGTETYGTYTSDYTADETFSVPFGDFDEFLFASGDDQLWLITDKNAVGGILTGEYYSDVARNIKKSSTSETSYTATWYNRVTTATTNHEDPWISVSNHNANDMVYGELGVSIHTTVISTRNGANVFVRSHPKPMHPDWSEILFVRAPKTSEEKWVRMSRSQWDAIAGEDYDGGIVDADILDAYPLKTTTTKAKRRNDGDTSPWVFAPPSTATSPVDEFTAVYASYDSASHAANADWDHQKPVGTEFQVFVRAPTWRDHYVGCMGAAVLPIGASLLGAIETVTTFLDAILMCSGYEYAGVMCGKTVICFSVDDPSQFMLDGECRGQDTSYDHGTCQAPENPNIGPDGSSMGGLSSVAVYSTKSRTHTCQAVGLNCGSGEAVHSDTTLTHSSAPRGRSYRYVRNGECNTGSEVNQYGGTAANLEEQLVRCAEICADYTGWVAQGFIVNSDLKSCYCESADSSTCGVDWQDGWQRYDFYAGTAEITQQTYLAGGRLPTPHELRTWLFNEAPSFSNSAAAVYNPERNGEDWMWLDGEFALRLYSEHQLVPVTTPQTPLPLSHWVGSEIPVVISGVSLTTWHCWTGSSYATPSWTQDCVQSCPYPNVDAVLTINANWCTTPQNLLSNTEARMANCGGGSYDWGANHYCPVWNPNGSPTNPGSGAVYVILDAGHPVTVKAFKWAASGNSNRMHDKMQVYRSDDGSSWTAITWFYVSASAGGSLNDGNPSATVDDMVGIFSMNGYAATARYWKFSPYGAQYQVNGLLLRICSTFTCEPETEIVTATDTATCSHCPTSSAVGDAVISMDDRSFNRANSEYVNVGVRSWNFATNGGFTLVGKLQMTGTPSSGWERIFISANALQNNDNAIQLLRHSVDNLLGMYICEGSTCCSKEDIPFEPNTWYTVIFRYVTSSRLMSLELNGVRYEKTCDSSFIVTDRTNIHNWIGKSHWPGNDFLSGDIAGLYIWDRYLNDIEVTAITQGIKINEKDDVHPDACMETCPSGTYRNTPFQNVVVAMDDASFDRSAEYYIDLGSKSFSLTSGFTAVTKLKFTNSIASHEKVFCFGVGATDNILLSRYSTQDKLYFQIIEGDPANACTLINQYQFPQDTWLTVVAKWRSSDNSISLTVDGNEYSATCTNGITGRVFTETYIGKSHWSDPYLSGDIAGLYIWDNYLSDADVATVVDSIHIASTDDALESKCACGRNTYAEPQETIHFHGNSLTVTWDDTVDYAVGRGGRLPTKDEMIAYLQACVDGCPATGWAAVYDESSSPSETWMDVSSNTLDSSRTSGNLLAWVHNEENCRSCRFGAVAPIGSTDQSSCTCRPDYVTVARNDADLEAVVGSTGWELVKKLPAYGTAWYTNDELNIREQAIGASIRYDFTDMNDLVSWKAYASKIGATTSIQSYTATDGAWAGSNWIGWLELPLPRNYDTLEVRWGHGYSSGVVKMCICETFGQQDAALYDTGSGYMQTYTSRCDNANELHLCSVVQTPNPNQDLTYGPALYKKGQVLRIEEVYATLNPDIVIILSNSNTQHAMPTLPDCVPYSQEACANAVPDGYTLQTASASHQDGCFCYLNSVDSGADAGSCYFGTGGQDWVDPGVLSKTSIQFRPFGYDCADQPQSMTYVPTEKNWDEILFTRNEQTVLGNNEIICEEDTSTHSWQEYHDQAIANGYRIPTVEEMQYYCIEHGPLFQEDMWIAVTSDLNQWGADYVQCGVHPSKSLGDSHDDEHDGGRNQGDDPKTYWSQPSTDKWHQFKCHVQPSNRDIIIKEDTSTHSWQEYHDQARADGGRLPTVQEMQEFCIEHGPLFQEDMWIAVTSDLNQWGADYVQCGVHPSKSLGDSHDDEHDGGRNQGADPKTYWSQPSTNTWHQFYAIFIPKTKWVHMTKANFDTSLAQNYAPGWVQVPVLSVSGNGETTTTGLTNYIEHTGIHALSSPWVTLAADGVPVTMAHMIYHEEGDHYDPVGHDWVTGDKPMQIEFRTFVRNSQSHDTLIRYRNLITSQSNVAFKPENAIFDGSRVETYSSVTWNFLASSGSGFTLFVRAKYNTGSVNFDAIFEFHDSSSDRIFLKRYQNQWYTGFYPAAGCTEYSMIGAITDDVWNDIVMSYNTDTKTLKLSINGGEILSQTCSTAGSSTFDSSNIKIGSDMYDDKLNGAIEFLYAYDQYIPESSWTDYFQAYKQNGQLTSSSEFFACQSCPAGTSVNNNICSSCPPGETCGQLFVHVTVQLAMTVEEFDTTAQEQYKEAIAATAGVAVSQVEIISITAVAPSQYYGAMRRLLSSSIDVETEITVPPPTTDTTTDTTTDDGAVEIADLQLALAEEIASQLTTTAIQTNLQQQESFETVDITVEEEPVTAATTQSVTDTVSCPAGEQPSGSGCEPCPIGTFKDHVGTASCTSCTGNKNTASTGSGNANLCLCIPGYFNAIADQACQACEVGKYRAGLASETPCTDCPTDTTTLTVGQDESVDCECVAGNTGPDGGPCTPCELNTYKSTVGSEACTACPTGSTTSSTGADAVSFCACTVTGYTGSPGDCYCDYGYTSTYTNGQSCEECDVNTFKNYIWDSVNDWCIACHMHWTNAGSPAGSAQCYCNAGYSGSLSTNHPYGECTACESGKYKATISAHACTDCGNGISPVGSTDVSSCSCDVGHTGPDGGACTACVSGTYKDTTGSGNCVTCPTDSTSPTASTSLSACGCNEGYTGPDGGPCTGCLAGTFKSATGSSPCSDCPDNSMSDAASTLPSACTALAGHYKDGDSFPACPDNSTSLPGSTDITECYALAGHYKDGDSFPACPEFSTSPANSTVITDCVCTAGYFWTESNTCVSCPVKTTYDASSDSCVCDVGYMDASTYTSGTSSSSCVANMPTSTCGPCQDTTTVGFVGSSDRCNFPGQCEACGTCNPGGSDSDSSRSTNNLIENPAFGSNCTYTLRAKSFDRKVYFTLKFANWQYVIGTELNFYQCDVEDCSQRTLIHTKYADCIEQGSCSNFGSNWGSSDSNWITQNGVLDPPREIISNTGVMQIEYTTKGLHWWDRNYGCKPTCLCGWTDNDYVTYSTGTGYSPECIGKCNGGNILADGYMCYLVFESGYGMYNFAFQAEVSNIFTCSPIYTNDWHNRRHACHGINHWYGFWHTDCVAGETAIVTEHNYTECVVLSDCIECPAGKFADNTNASACQSCPVLSTSLAGSTSSLNCTCVPDTTSIAASNETVICACERGFTEVDGACMECEMGKYKETVGSEACSTCEDSITVNFATAATSFLQCNCPPGHFSDVLSGQHVCIPCESNTYVPALWNFTGTYGVDDVIILSSGAGIWTTQCSPCTMHSNSGIQATQCNCNTGYYGNVNGPCTYIPVDHYQTDFNAIAECPSTSTSPAGSLSIDACICDAGYQQNSAAVDEEGYCLQCEAGKWSNAGSNSCSDCPEFSTSDPSSTQINDCRCNAGYTGNDGGVCTPCAIDTYKESIGNASCTSCQPFSSTQGLEASTNPTSCICDDSYTDTGDGSCDRTCAAGFQSTSNELSCEPCPTGTYKPDIGLNSCTPCPQFSSMSPDIINATSIELCVCQHGYRKTPDGQSCQPCPVGTFNNQGGEDCFTCYRVATA